MYMKKDLAKIIKKLEAQGWVCSLKHGGHWCFASPDKTFPLVHTGSSPSDNRALKNLCSTLRKFGATGF